MKKIGLMALGLAVLMIVTSLYGCSQGSTTPGELPSKFSVSLNSQQEGIQVGGRGEVSAVPDIATLRLGIEAQEANVAEAQTKANEAMNKVMTALTGSGVAEEDIQTQYFNIRQRTKWNRETEEETVVGYQVTNKVIAKIRVLDYESYTLDYKVGIIIAAVAEAGGDLTRIDSLSFSIDDPSVYYEEAREKAMVDAKAKAEQLAELAGVSLGKPTYVSEGIHIPSPIYPRAVFEQAVSAPAPVETPISPGEMEISLTVQLAYAIL